MCGAVPGPAGSLHPAGPGEGSGVSVGLQPAPGGRLPPGAGTGVHPAGGDQEPCPLRQVALWGTLGASSSLFLSLFCRAVFDFFFSTEKKV